MNQTALIIKEIDKERSPKSASEFNDGFNRGLTKASEVLAKYMRENHHLFLQQDEYRKFFVKKAPEYSMELLRLSDQMRNEVLNVCDMLSTYPQEK